METDDFDDPALALRLRQWGAAVRADGGVPADVGPDLAAMHRRLDSAARPSRPHVVIGRRTLVAAAALFLGLLLWSLRDTPPVLPSFAGTAPELRDVAVSARASLDRGRPEPPLLADGKAYLHFYSAMSGSAVAILLTPKQGARLLLPSPLPLGDDRLGPFALPAAGRHAVVAVTTTSQPTTEQVAAILAVVDAAALAMQADDDAAMQAATAERFAGAAGLRAVCVPLLVR